MISIGGDTDTICAIGGALAEVLFGIPPEIEAEANKRLDEHALGVIERFRNRLHSVSPSPHSLAIRRRTQEPQRCVGGELSPLTYP